MSDSACQVLRKMTGVGVDHQRCEKSAGRLKVGGEASEGVAIMCKAMEDMRNEAAKEAERMKAIRMARVKE